MQASGANGLSAETPQARCLSASAVRSFGHPQDRHKTSSLRSARRNAIHASWLPRLFWPARCSHHSQNR